MFKKIMAWVLLIVLTATAAVGGTLAYLTDRDSEANVFTVGNVDITLNDVFDQNSELMPGKDIDKVVSITNNGPEAAYVWYTYAIPQALDGELELTFANESKWTPYGESIGTKEVDGVVYNVYAMLHNEVVPAEKTTDVSLTGVMLDPSIDITPEGDMYTVVDGVTTPLGWNVNETENPIIFINAFAIQTQDFTSVTAAYNAFAGQWGNMVDAGTYDVAAAADTWDGTADTDWYNDTDTEFEIMTAEQLAGFAELVDDGNTFEGKTVKLGANIDLNYVPEGADEPVCFDPIGSYRNDTYFKGTFDGQNHTIENLNQNTWELDNGYYYTDCGLGLFGAVEGGTVKNLIVDNASISGESALCGVVAAAAADATFENITVTNSYVMDYQYYAGGIVGWASGTTTFNNCDVDASTTVGAQWGDFDNSNGGLIGGCGGSSTIYLKDCDVSCRIDAYNDVTSTYQWYAYRRSGMLIGNTGKTETVDGATRAVAPQLIAENCTVTYGNWANYTYCEFAGTSWPYVRAQAGISNSAYSNPRYGHPTDANGNEVVDINHVHNEGEDHQILCVFDQLYGGGQGVYGTATHSGVTVIYNNK